MWEIAIWFFIFMFAINGFALFLNDAVASSGYSILNPFTNSTIVFPAQPDPIAFVASINTTTATNSTGGSDVGIWDTFNYGWNATIFGINMLTGGFIFQAIVALVPVTAETLILTALIQGVVGIFLIITIIHFLRAIF